MITTLGSLSIGAAVPGAQLAALAGVTGINLALPDILARLAALQSFAPQPISFGAQLALANQILASITLSISMGLPVPSVDAQIAAVLAIVADLLAAVSQIEAQLAILVDFTDLLGTAGISAYAYAGTVGAFGGELATALGGGGDACNALVLLTRIPATWAAMSQVFKVTP
jgi:hypothetical protein